MWASRLWSQCKSWQMSAFATRTSTSILKLIERLRARPLLSAVHLVSVSETQDCSALLNVGPTYTKCLTQLHWEQVHSKGANPNSTLASLFFGECCNKDTQLTAELNNAQEAFSDITTQREKMWIFQFSWVLVHGPFENTQPHCSWGQMGQWKNEKFEHL